MFLNQLMFNSLLYISSIFGILTNRRNILLILICFELSFLSINLNFITFSVYFEDLYGQLMSLFITTVTGSESAIGLALVILYNRIRGSIQTMQYAFLKN